MPRGGDDRLRLEIAGPRVSPKTVPTLEALELARAYLDLLQRIAEESAPARLKFEGIAVETGSAVLAFNTNSPEAARDAAQQAGVYLRAIEMPPPGLIDPVRRVRTAVLRLPTDFTTSVCVGKWRRHLEVVESPHEGLRGAVVTLRAVPVRVGGARPAVRFRSASEESDFTLRVADEETARRFGGLLYREVEIVATVFRDGEGEIVQGTVDQFEAVAEGDSVAAWRSWYRANCKEWPSLDAADHDVRSGRDH
jgi:hypothetical protein